MTADRANTPRPSSNGTDWDLDQLADYAAGLLDEAGAASIAAVLERDPAAAELHAALVYADDLVRAELRDLPTVSMPADVAARLDAALAMEFTAADPITVAPAVDELPTPGTVPAVAAPSAETVAARAPLTTLGEREPGASHPSQGNVVPLRRRRWYKGAGAVAAGVAILAGGAVGVQQLTGADQASDNSTTSARGDSSSVAGAPPQASAKSGDAKNWSGERPAEAAAPIVRATGTNYQRASLAAQVAALTDPAGNDPKYTVAPSDAPSALRRLALGDLTRCLDLLGIPAAAPGLTVDYATFDGSPAVVVTVTASSDAIDVTVAGPECGEAGTDLKLRTTVPSS